MIRVVCEMENLKNEFFDDLIEKNESYIVSKWILHSIPYIFEENLLAYINWKEKLSEKAMALATKVYENIQKEQQAQASSSNEEASESSKDSKDGDVKDAEYEEK